MHKVLEALNLCFVAKQPLDKYFSPFAGAASVGLVHFDLNNKSIRYSYRATDGCNSGITAGVAESAQIDNKNPRMNAII